jgi:GTP pyrophosphokinase
MAYAIELEVVSDDRPGLLADLTSAISGEKSNIRRIEARTEESKKGYIAISLEASDLRHLEKIIGRVKGVPGVREVVRKYNVPGGESEIG